MNDEVCHVCGEVMDENRANCNDCGRDFHLALRVDVAARDCGDAWIDDEIQVLFFACNLCLGRAAHPAREARKRYARRAGGAAAVARARKRTSGTAGRAPGGAGDASQPTASR